MLLSKIERLNYLPDLANKNMKCDFILNIDICKAVKNVSEVKSLASSKSTAFVGNHTKMNEHDS